MDSFYKQTKLNHKFHFPIILDLGANAGLESKKLYDIYGPDCSVILVEPFPDNINTIKFNIKKWGLEDRFFIDECAVDVVSGVKEFGYQSNMSGINGRFNGSLDPFNWKTWNYSGTIKVKTKTLDEICSNPNIVKIDIERQEYIIFPYLVELDSIQVIYLELHGPCYSLNVKQFLEKHLEGTGLEITGWYKCYQSQREVNDAYKPIESKELINRGEDFTVIIERN